jgi:DNA phosphorothioation-dependent restriction protein DptG
MSYTVKYVRELRDRIDFLSAQLKERDEKYNKLWELFEKQTEAKSLKDQEIERLKEVSPDHIKNAYKENAEMWRDEYNNTCKGLRNERIITNELREALKWALDNINIYDNPSKEDLDLYQKCRKLIGN